MDKVKKLELIQRSLGLRHKIKVHESMKTPETHEDLALAFLAKWELEDELHAIEELLAEGRSENVAEKKELITERILKYGSAKPPKKTSKKKTSSKKKSH